MNKIKGKSKSILFLILFCLLSTGCKKKSNIIENDVLMDKTLLQMEEEKTDIEQENKQNETDGITFSNHYKRDYGQIKADFDVEVPADFDNEAKKVNVLSRDYIDENIAYTLYVEGKNILETHINEASKYARKSTIYLLEDGEDVSTGNDFFYSSGEHTYYSELAVADEAWAELYGKHEVTFETGEKCIEKVREYIEELGCSTDDFEFFSYPLSYIDLESREEEKIADGLLKSERKKGKWSEEDDAYFIYAYQKAGQLPIIHETMMMGYEFVKDTADMAPIQAIYSAKGLESLYITAFYLMEESEQTLELVSLDQIVDTVIEKYSYLLTDSTFTITRGKLCQMVRKNNQQEYETQPVWYFEITENDSKVSYMLVNAETAEEVSLGSVGDMFG